MAAAQSVFGGAFMEAASLDAIAGTKATSPTLEDGSPVRYHVIYNFTAYHAVPTMINLVNTGLARATYGVSIATTNAPFNYTSAQQEVIDSFSGLVFGFFIGLAFACLLYTSPSPRDS